MGEAVVAGGGKKVDVEIFPLGFQPEKAVLRDLSGQLHGGQVRILAAVHSPHIDAAVPKTLRADEQGQRRQEKPAG